MALHLYPFRDQAWPEDLGRSPRVTSFRGFVLGDNADQQVAALIEAVEAPGPGQLVHPSLGAMTVQVVSFAASDNPERGRVWSFEMSVVPALERLFPNAAKDTPGLLARLFGDTGGGDPDRLQTAPRPPSRPPAPAPPRRRRRCRATSPLARG